MNTREPYGYLEIAYQALRLETVEVNNKNKNILYVATYALDHDLLPAIEKIRQSLRARISFLKNNFKVPGCEFSNIIFKTSIQNDRIVFTVKKQPDFLLDQFNHLAKIVIMNQEAIISYINNNHSTNNGELTTLAQLGYGVPSQEPSKQCSAPLYNLIKGFDQHANFDAELASDYKFWLIYNYSQNEIFNAVAESVRQRWAIISEKLKHKGIDLSECGITTRNYKIIFFALNDESSKLTQEQFSWLGEIILKPREGILINIAMEGELFRNYFTAATTLENSYNPTLPTNNRSDQSILHQNIQGLFSIPNISAPPLVNNKISKRTILDLSLLKIVSCDPFHIKKSSDYKFLLSFDCTKVLNIDFYSISNSLQNKWNKIRERFILHGIYLNECGVRLRNNKIIFYAKNSTKLDEEQFKWLGEVILIKEAISLVDTMMKGQLFANYLPSNLEKEINLQPRENDSMENQMTHGRTQSTQVTQHPHQTGSIPLVENTNGSSQHDESVKAKAKALIEHNPYLQPEEKEIAKLSLQKIIFEAPSLTSEQMKVLQAQCYMLKFFQRTEDKVKSNREPNNAEQDLFNTSLSPLDKINYT
ncbi:MAG: hypothetical protein H0W64_09380 [Gammaproteobacteria bacterium]|nr:hypothetical protein [Gammaproteobacteria bacterium]